MAEPCHLADLMTLDITSNGVASLLLIVVWVWGAARSCFSEPQSLQAGSCLWFVPMSAQTCKGQNKQCFWSGQSSFHRGANSLVCWFVLQTSPSVCNHSSPASIREVIAKYLSLENNRQYKTPVATERARTQSTMRGDQISLDAHADPADRVVCVRDSKQHPIYPSTSTVCLLVCTGAADKRPGNEFLPGKAECEAEMNTKTKV